MSVRQAEGIYAATVTPFNTDLRVDFGALDELVDFLVAAKINGLYVCGTTGEFPLLSDDERRKVAERVVERTRGRVPVLVHVGHVRNDLAVSLARHAKDCGASGVSVAPPYYFAYSAEELYCYFHEVAEAVGPDFPVYVYNIPQRTTNVVSAELIRRLVETTPNVVGVKDSSGSLTHLLGLVEAGETTGLAVLQGSDEQLLPALVAGCAGSVSGNANVFPELFANLWREVKSGSLDSARRYQRLIGQVARAFGYGNVPMIKAGLKVRGIGNGLCRPPFISISGKAFEELRETVGALLELMAG